MADKTANKTIDYVVINVKFDEYDNHEENLVSKESLQISLGKIQKWKTDFHPVVWTGVADTVNGHTVESDVPADAVFTDTLYELPVASDETLGGIKVGYGLDITDEGVLYITNDALNYYLAGDGISIDKVVLTPSGEIDDIILPEGYQRLQYIEANGSQKLDTELKLAAGYTIEMVANKLSSDYVGTFFSYVMPHQWVVISAYSNGIEIVYIEGDYDYKTSISKNELNGDMHQIFTIVATQSTISIYNEDKSYCFSTKSATNYYNWSNSAFTDTLYLCGWPNNVISGSPRWGQWMSGRVYNFKLYDSNDALIANLIPCKNNIINNVGMYDIINKRFLYSRTSTPFIAGPNYQGVTKHQINLLPATTSTLGGVIVGDGINVNEQGVISVDIPSAKEYVEGEGIQIRQTNQKHITIDSSLFDSGMINLSTGDPEENTTVLRMMDFYDIDGVDKFSILSYHSTDEPFLYACIFYDENDIFIDQSSPWKTIDEMVTNIPTNATQIKLLLKLDGYANILPLDIKTCKFVQYIDNTDAYEVSLRAATKDRLGGIKLGDGLTADEDGTVSVDTGSINAGVTDLQVKEDNVGVLTSTKGDSEEDLDVFKYLNIMTLNVEFDENT